MEVSTTTTHERVRQLRKELGLTQSEFGKRIRLSQNHLTGIETGKRNLTDTVSKLICDEFNVNEDWLRTGEGDMFRTLSSDEEFIKIMTEIQVSDDPIIRRILKAYWSLSDSDKAAVQRLVQNFVDSETQTK